MNDLQPTKEKRFSIKSVAIFTFIATLIVCVLRIFSLIFFFEADIQYYAIGATLPTIMHILLAVFTIAVMVASIVCKDKDISSASEGSTYVTFSSTLSAALLLLNAFFVFYNFISFPTRPATVFQNQIIIGISFALGSFYFFSALQKKRSEASALFVIPLIAAVTLIVANKYFDVTVPMNSPNQIVFNMAAVSALLFFIAEAKLIANSAKSAVYVSTLLCAVVLCGAYSIPSLIVFGFNSTDFQIYALFFAFFLYFVSRTLSLISPRPAEKELPETVTETTDEQTEETDTEENSSENDGENAI